MTTTIRERLLDTAAAAGVEPDFENTEGGRVKIRDIAKDMMKGEVPVKVLTKHGARLVLSASKRGVSYRALAAALIHEAEEFEFEWQARHAQEVTLYLAEIEKLKLAAATAASAPTDDDTETVEDTSAGAEDADA